MNDDGTPDPHPDEADLLAAEYALGLLDEDGTRAAVERMRVDPAFAAEVRDWQERLALLAVDLPLVPPHYTVKKRLDAALFTPPARRGIGPLGWVAGALAAGAIAAAAWVLIAPMQMRPDHMAELSAPAHGLRVAAAFDTSASELEVTLAQGTVPAQADLELWWIAPGAAPVSLGVAPHSGSARLPLPATLGDAAGVTIALSSEPQGGSPTGQPTGPVIATAPLTVL